MNKSILCDQIYDAVLLRDLHCNWEIVCCLGREINIYSLLGESRVGGLVVNFNDVQLQKKFSNLVTIMNTQLPLHLSQSEQRT